MIDQAALRRWLDANELPGVGLPVGVRWIAGGSQNEIYEIYRGAFHAVLRKPPDPAPPARDDGILREWRIISALAHTAVPHAQAIALCADRSILGRPFYLMGHVEGWSPMNTQVWPAPFDVDAGAREALAFELVQGAVRMEEVDWRSIGLEDLGRPEGFHDRQVPRWMSVYSTFTRRELPGMDVATRWLASRRPLDYKPGLMHGDYQLANVMFRYDVPGTLEAIIDWEMGTVGDPKLDLAWALQGWPDDTSRTRGSFHVHYADMEAMPTRRDLLHRYATLSGRQVDDIDYYLVLARWKLAIVLEQGYQRAGDDPRLLAFGPRVLELMSRAAELAERSKYRGPHS